MRALVCGGRDYADKDAVFYLLGLLHRGYNFEVVIHGDASGADALAAAWARDRGVPVAAYPADWDAHGKKAGPIRNQQMLDEGRPDIVIAFPGGRGTYDMLKKAAAADEKQCVNLGQGIEIFDAAAMPHRWFPRHAGMHLTINECMHCNIRQDTSQRFGHIVCPLRNPWACKSPTHGHALPHLQAFCEQIAGHAGDHSFLTTTWAMQPSTKGEKP